MNIEWDGQDFSGAKIALICEGQVVTYVRDDRPDIPFPNMFDLPGGGREGDESPIDCAFREVHEEFGIRLKPDHLRYWRVYPFWNDPNRLSHFFIAHVSQEEVAAIKFGDEGHSWQMMVLEEFLSHERAVGQLKVRLAECVQQMRDWQRMCEAP